MRSTPRRAPVHKGKSANQFRHNTSRTHRKNLAPPPMRGGYRL